MKDEKSVFITGAGKGLGLALTRLFLSKNWKVAALVRNERDADSLKQINETLCFPVISDVSVNDVQGSILKALESFGSIHVLINNAGIGGNSAFLSETKADEVLELLNVHCAGALRVTQAALPFMQKNGTVINVSSRFGSIAKVSAGELDHVSCSYSYRIAKAAQNMLTQCLCREFQNSDIKICSIHPGRLKTDAASSDADNTAKEAAHRLFGMLKAIEHGAFYSLFEGKIDW